MASPSEVCSDLDRPALDASSTGALPMDTLYEILQRLPAKDLCRLRAVSRTWRALLSGSQFAGAHATRHPGPLLIAAYRKYDEDGSLVEIMDLSGHSLKKVPKEEGDRVVSMAKDLVSVSNRAGFSSRLLNPATGAAYYFLDMKGDGPSYLFGQSASKGERKVLRRTDVLGSDSRIHQLIEVCTLNNSYVPCNVEGKTGRTTRGLQAISGPVWSLMGLPTSCLRKPFLSCPSFSMRVNVEKIIITFDLETEEWGTILGPNISFVGSSFQVLVLNAVGSLMLRRLTLADLNGSLAVVCGYGLVPTMDIWVLTDTTNGDWVKQYSITFDQSILLPAHPVLVLDDQRLVVYMEEKGLLQIYNPRRDTFTDVVRLEDCSSISLYTGNLLSLEY